MTGCETGVDDPDYIYKHTKHSLSNQNMRYKGFAIKKNIPELMTRDYNFVEVDF